MNWRGKLVVVTGGGSGIGRAACRAFSSEGAHVIVANRTVDKGEETVQLIRNAGGSAEYAKVDVTLEDDIKRLIADAVAAHGAIDVLVNNAAVCPQARITDLSLAEWNHILATNLTSVFVGCREVIPHMVRSGGGSIVNVASIHALATLPGHSAYAAAKGGIVAMTRAIALDVAKQNIRVNTVLPGAVHTPMLKGSAKKADTPREEIMKEWNEAQPIGRVGQPEEIASVILFAASPDNSFMTGAQLVSDGGLTIDL